MSSTDLERHCTLVYAVARPGPLGVELTLSLAGHHPPLVLRSAGGTRTVEPVGLFGTAIGLLDDPELYDDTTRLDPGDVMCLFTDGLVESRNGAELFGSEGVERVMQADASSPEDLAGALVDAARAFHHSPQLADDLAILVLRAVDVDGRGPSRERAAEATRPQATEPPAPAPDRHEGVHV